MSKLSDFDFKRYLSLGREVTKYHKEFKFLAPLGNDYARKRSALKFMLWLKEHRDTSLDVKLDKAIELLGKAELLKNVKEVMRMCLALGDTTPRRKFK